jgi:PAS domain S-box-containing protein
MTMSQATAKQKALPTAYLSGRSKRLLWFGMFIAVVLIGLIFAIAYHSIVQTRKNMEDELRQRQITTAASRVEMTDAWLASLVEKSRGLTNSDIFQLYASQVDSLPGGIPLLFNPPEADEHGDEAGVSRDTVEALSSQVKMMSDYLIDFVFNTDFSSARIVNSKAETYLTTESAMPPLDSEAKEFVKQVIQSGQVFYAPLAYRNKGLMLDVYLPIMARFNQKGNTPVSVLVLGMQVDRKLKEILAPGVVIEKGRKVRMIQKNGDIYQNVVPDATLLRQATTFKVGENRELPFALRQAFGAEEKVYSSGRPLRSTDWWIVIEHDAALVEGNLAERARTIYTLAGLLSVALVLLISAVWWRLVGQEQRVINTEIRNLLATIDEQKKLLDGINSTMTDPISLTDDQGIFRYVNNAFALAVGRKPADILGLDGPAVFGFDTARRLNAADQHVLMTGESISITEVLWLQSLRYHFQISKTPLHEDGSRTPRGIVSVFRDITELVETQERSRRVVQQTIDALVRTIEEADPFLGGHSRIMGGIASLMARQLRLPEADVATVEAAANLSQIGKMFVPREILLKPGVLTPEEKQEMEKHVEYARNVLKGIEFDLPVVEAIYEMNERLDGRGYPRGLAGDEISMDARVLAVANAFTAMAKPRSYRPALPVEDVITTLERQTDSYDQNVVNALKQVIATPAGERLVQQAAHVKAM